MPRDCNPARLAHVATVNSRDDAADKASVRAATRAVKPKAFSAPERLELIDRVGLGGFRIGGAFVSAKHANFIQAGDGATAADVKAVIDEVRDQLEDLGFPLPSLGLGHNIKPAAFDGDFTELRGLLSGRRVLTLETTSAEPPRLAPAELIRTESGRHEYAFDATQVKLSELLEQAAAQTWVKLLESVAGEYPTQWFNFFDIWNPFGV